MKIGRLVVLLLLLGLIISLAQAESNFDPTVQTEMLFYNEAYTVYLGNLARHGRGVPPLRWNRQMTHAARWFSWDSTENRPPGFCGHEDTQGKSPQERIRAFGYQGRDGTENAFCGYVTPEEAIDGWLDSAGHEANLLDPNSREVGLGYYQRQSDERGYITQDFGHDPVYPPVVIMDEALSTTGRQVDLYIYDRETGGSFKAMGPAIEMQVSNDACFSGAVWEPYAAEKSWQLEPGDPGWRSVYVRTRDALSRISTVSDTIYLGSDLPLRDLQSTQLSTTADSLTFYGLGHASLPRLQFSPSWLVDDTFETFELKWGSGQRVTDPAAWGQTAFRLGPPTGNLSETFAWVWTTDFFKEIPLVAYARLKVAHNLAAAEVARISVTGGQTLSLKGTDFAAPNVYQEFPLPFTFPAAEQFLIFGFSRRGQTDVTIDAVTIFTAPQPISSPLTWSIPGGNYRGQGIWVRYTDGGQQFSAYTEATTMLPTLSAAPHALILTADLNDNPRLTRTLTVTARCPPLAWQATGDAPWLRLEGEGDKLQVNIDAASLSIGLHTALITISASDIPSVQPVLVPVRLWVFDQAHAIHLPLLHQGD